MEPRIQYAQTADGVSIAYSTLGEGTPIVYSLGPPFSHMQLEWELPEFRSWYERLARNAKLIRYDTRGTGLSEREVTGLSLDSYVLDLEAVVDQLGLEEFVLLAILHAGPVAITYAAHHPERVSLLALWCSYARYSDLLRLPSLQTFQALRSQDWAIYTETVAHTILGWSEGEQARRFAAFCREAAEREIALEAFRAIADFDVSGLLPRVQSPTLVIHRRKAPLPDIGVATALASRIPGARLAIIEGESLLPLSEGDITQAVAPLDEFLGNGKEAATTSEPTGPGAFRTILFTDMEGSTSLTQRLGDARAQDVLRTHNTVVRGALKAHSGTETKHTGDGIMASFASPSGALKCAIDIQRGFAQHNASNPDGAIRVRIGLNAGEPVAEEEDLFGTAVQLAARICAHAEPGQVLLPEGVRHLVAGKRFLFADIGDIALRGFEDPVRLYEVRWQEDV